MLGEYPDPGWYEKCSLGAEFQGLHYLGRSLLEEPALYCTVQYIL